MQQVLHFTVDLDVNELRQSTYSNQKNVTPPKIGLLKGRKVLPLNSQTMKNSNITEAQIVKGIKEYEGGP